MRLVIASNNKGKIAEMSDLLADLGVEIISQREMLSTVSPACILPVIPAIMMTVMRIVTGIF